MMMVSLGYLEINLLCFVGTTGYLCAANMRKQTLFLEEWLLVVHAKWPFHVSY